MPVSDSSEYPDIVEIESRLKSDFSERDRMIEQMRSLRYMEDEPEVPPAIEVETVRAPIAHQIIERMVGTIAADPLTLSVPPSSEKESAQEEASKIERFTLPALQQLERQQDTDVTDRFVETLIADGHGCLKMLYAPQLWKGFPRRKKGDEDKDYNKATEEWKRNKPLPVVWQWCDPLTVYPVWSDFGLAGVLETDVRDPLALNPNKWNVQKLDYGDLSRMKRDEGGTGGVRFRQWWTQDTLTYMVEDTVVHHAKHKYNNPPYAYAFGLGAASSEPHKAGMSCLWPIKDLLPYLDRLLSQKATAIRMWCWPTLVFKQTALGQQAMVGEGGATGLRQLELRPGVPVSLYQDEELTFLTWQGNGPDADEQIQLIMSMVEKAGLSDPMYGASGGESGYAINQLIAAARMRFKPIVAHAERAIESQIVTLWDIIEYQIKQTVYVYGRGDGKGERGWIGLGPDDLNGYRQVRVHLNPIMPTDEYARASQAINLKQSGIWSLERAMEHTGVEQPDEEFQRILLDELKQDQNVRAIIVQEAAKRLGLKLQRGNLTPQGLMQAYPEMSPAGQQAVAGQMQQAAPPGQDAQSLGMSAPPPQAATQGPGLPPRAGELAGAAPPAGLDPQHMQMLGAIAQQVGVPPEQLLQQLQQAAAQRGIPLAALIEALYQRLMAGQGGAQQQAQGSGFAGQSAAVGGPGQLPRNPGLPQASVQAAPGVAAAPGPPTPGRVGPQVRPQGVAQGRPSGPQRGSGER